MLLSPIGKFTYQVFPVTKKRIEITAEEFVAIKAHTACFNDDLTAVIPYQKPANEIAQETEEAYKHAVVAEIRKQYTMDDELAINRQKESKPEEFAAYFTYCESCKSTIKSS